MRRRRGSKCTIGDIIASLITKNNPPTIARNKSTFDTPTHQNATYSTSGESIVFFGRQASEGQNVIRKTGPSADFRNWLTSTPPTHSHLLEASPLGASSNIFQKYASQRHQSVVNPERQCEKWEVWEAYGSRRRQSSKIEALPEASDPKLTNKLIDNFKELKMQAKLPPRTTSHFYSTSRSNSKHTLTLKVNSTFVTIPGPSTERCLWRRRRNPNLTFYK